MRKRAYNRKERKTGGSVKLEDSNNQRRSQSIHRPFFLQVLIDYPFLSRQSPCLSRQSPVLKRHKHRILRFTLLCHGSVTASICDDNNIMIGYSHNFAF